MSAPITRTARISWITSYSRWAGVLLGGTEALAGGVEEDGQVLATHPAGG
ncbi:hypothetical protein GCM10020000_86220 [Streptomyces olivoverticillatus]